MDTLVVASSAADSAAAAAVTNHHTELASALRAHADAVVRAAVPGGADAAGASRHALLAWCEHEMLPHVRAEEDVMYPAAHAEPAGRLLVDAMLAEHQLLVGLVEAVRLADSPVRAATEAVALRTVFDSHLAKENDQILPLLASSADVSLHEVLDGMHELLGADGAQHAPEQAGDHGGHNCSCGESDPVGELPELDARVVPHKIRHATVFGALAAVQPGGGLVLVAPHDPLPLLQQIEARHPGVFAVDYLERGPEAWRLRFMRS